MKHVVTYDRREQKRYWIISACILLFFGVLSFLFPYTGDDWAWGSSIGVERLTLFFDNYNGRYLGNLLVMLLTRSKLLDVIVMATSYYLACWICYKYTKKRRNVALVSAVLVFLVMPREIFAQSIVWTAGYANYVPSALISVIYIFLIRNITEEGEPSYPKYLSIITFVMGVCGALFMENITLFNICLGVAAIGYAFLKHRKAYLTHFSFLIGAVIGAIIMFSNSAYATISAGEDGYRSAPSGLRAFYKTCIDHADTICETLILSNPLMCIIASLLLFVLTAQYLKKAERLMKKNGAIFILGINIVSLFFVLCRNVLTYCNYTGGYFDILWGRKIEFLLTVLYVGTLFLEVLLCVEKYRRFRMLLPIYCVPVVVAPLLVVNPIGPRCFFAPYLMMMVFIVELFDYILDKADIKELGNKILAFGLVMVVLVQGFVYSGIFYPIYHYDSLRNEYAKLQSDNNEKQVVICELPNAGYLWTSTPHNELWETRYKLFYDLEEDVELKVIGYSEFDSFVKEYSKE